MAHVQLPVVDSPHTLTMRRDAWWVQPAVVAVLLTAFIVYATWAAFQNAHYRFGPYLSPFYSPELFGDPATAWFGEARGLAGVATLLPCAPDPALSGAVPGHLLLLPRGILQGDVGRPPELHGSRAPSHVPW